MDLLDCVRCLSVLGMFPFYVSIYEIANNNHCLKGQTGSNKKIFYDLLWFKLNESGEDAGIEIKGSDRKKHRPLGRWQGALNNLVSYVTLGTT